MINEIWRFRCPNGHSNIRKIKQRNNRIKIGNDNKTHGTTHNGQWYCKSCGDWYNKPIDIRTQ